MPIISLSGTIQHVEVGTERAGDQRSGPRQGFHGRPCGQKLIRPTTLPREPLKSRSSLEAYTGPTESGCGLALDFRSAHSSLREPLEYGLIRSTRTFRQCDYFTRLTLDCGQRLRKALEIYGESHRPTIRSNNDSLQLSRRRGIPGEGVVDWHQNLAIGRLA